MADVITKMFFRKKEQLIVKFINPVNPIPQIFANENNLTNHRQNRR